MNYSIVLTVKETMYPIASLNIINFVNLRSRQELKTEDSIWGAWSSHFLDPFTLLAVDPWTKLSITTSLPQMTQRQWSPFFKTCYHLDFIVTNSALLCCMVFRLDCGQPAWEAAGLWWFYRQKEKNQFVLWNCCVWHGSSSVAVHETVETLIKDPAFLRWSSTFSKSQPSLSHQWIGLNGSGHAVEEWSWVFSLSNWVPRANKYIYSAAILE